MNTLPFRANYEIKDPQILFGRKEELQKLCDFAEGLLQIEVIGARRFGKTCLLKSFITLQKENLNSKTYPLYVDVYSDGIKGTPNVYRYLTSQLVANLLNDGYIEEGELTIDDFNITPSKNWKKVFKQLGVVEDEIDQIGIFDEAIELFSQQLGQTILLIFDEYEKAVDAFDNINGLMHIRKMTNSSSSLSFWIAGASSWKKFVVSCTQDIRGSGVFNGITFNVDVCPLKKEDFHDMWNYECGLIGDDIKRKHLESLWEKVFTSSGGVPCFAKEIGGFIYIEDNYPQYYRLKNHFVELEKNLTDSEIKCLRMLSFSPQEFKASEKPESIVTLEQYGLICTDENNKYYVVSHFFAEFIRSGVYEEQLSNDGDYTTIEPIVREIADAIYKINDKWMLLYGKYMFDPANDTQRLYQDLSSRCDSREKVPNFVNSIYLLYWEGAKENNKAGEKIPEQFKVTMFRKSMDRIRHILGKAHQQDKLEQNWGQLDKATALKEIWGEPIEPQCSQDWLYFQECMLKRFLLELNEIYESIEPQSAGKAKLHPSKTRKNTHRPTANKHLGLEDGKEYEGVIVDTTDQYGNTFLKVKCNQFPFPLQIRSKRNAVDVDDIVSFRAVVEPNKNDPQKKFWFAEDVHLKE